MNTDKDSFARFEILGYDNSDYKGSPTVFKAQINPESFDRTLEFDSATQKTRHKSGNNAKDSVITGEKYRVELILDGTGAIDNVGKGDISVKVNEFLDAVYYDVVDKKSKKPSRRPRFLKLYYCNAIFKCMASSLSLKYTLFSRDGKPLRARLNCEFSSEGAPVDVETKTESISSGDEPLPIKAELSKKEGDVEKIKESAYEKDYHSIHPSR